MSADNKPVGRLAGKTALVTGVGAGIGQGIALMFAQEGASVFGCDVDFKAAEETGRQAADAATPLKAIARCDLTSEVEVAQWVSSARDGDGKIDILVNAAAFAVMGWIEDLSLKDFRATLTGEIELVFIACREVWPHMKAAGGGSIINFSSANSHMALKGSPALAHCAGKGGVLAMTHQLAMEGAPFNIRANSIAPGLVVTASTKPAIENPAFAEAALSKLMLRRFGQPADIAHAATYLASDESSWVTASELRVDGGGTHW